jgi:16S rRNA (guanine1207-N2)-methyltransferase
MNQYFTENPNLPTRERELTTETAGKKLRFITNNGLFSCDKPDDASLLLINTLPPITGTLLDLGCGYGLIGISLATINKITLTQSDINAQALTYAEKNAALNGINATFVHSNGFEKIPQNFGTITLNPPIHAGKEVMYRLYEESAAHLNPGGTLYIVIQKKHGAESSIKKLKELFATCEILYKRKGYFVLAAR